MKNQLLEAWLAWLSPLTEEQKAQLELIDKPKGDRRDTYQQGTA